MKAKESPEEDCSKTFKRVYLTLSDLGDLKHSMPGGGADSSPLFISVVA